MYPEFTTKSALLFRKEENMPETGNKMKEMITEKKKNSYTELEFPGRFTWERKGRQAVGRARSFISWLPRPK